VYGYNIVPAEYHESLCNWLGTRHGWRPDPSWVVDTIGVVPAIAACLKAFTQPGDKVLLMSPVYNCFFSCVRNYGYELVDVPLKTEGDNRYMIDFEALEAAASGVKVMLICSPHNPAGRVWSREELARVADICLRHGIIPVCDEIHCEFIMPGQTFVPFASISPEVEKKSVILYAGSKAFNIAGLQLAAIIAKDPALRAAVDKAININETCDVNPFGIVAAMAAYTPEGSKWLDELNSYVYANYMSLRKALAPLPEFHLYELEGTYLAWLDIKALGMASADVEKSLEEIEKVRVNAGSMYGQEGFVRINLACPASICEEGIRRIVTGLKRLISK
jgi:cystathionine beta-lyase